MERVLDLKRLESSFFSHASGTSEAASRHLEGRRTRHSWVRPFGAVPQVFGGLLMSCSRGRIFDSRCRHAPCRLFLHCRAKLSTQGNEHTMRLSIHLLTDATLGCCVSKVPNTNAAV